MESSIPDRFVAIINLLCVILGGRDHRYGRYLRLLPLESMFVHNRLQAIARRFVAVAARLANGTLGKRPVRKSRPTPEPGAAKPSPRPQTRWPARLLNRPGWLHARLRPATYAGSALRDLFMDPRMQAMLDAAPQLRAIIRPLCTMLDVEQPPIAQCGPTAPKSPPRKRRCRRRPIIWAFVPLSPKPNDLPAVSPPLTSKIA